VWYYQNMVKSAAVLPKPSKGRRPATGRDPVRAIRLSDECLAKVVGWAAKQDDAPGRSEAIRRLVELGLTATRRAVPTSKRAAAKARTMARATIDQLSDRSAPPEEQAKRKRRLIKGPTEFREMRADVPKPKG
jgi:hypothetical protein